MPAPLTGLDMTTFLDIVNQAIFGWLDVTGIDVSVLDPAKTYWKGGELDQKRELQRLQQMIDCDPTGLTAFLSVRSDFDHLLRETTFSARDLIWGGEAVEATIAPLRRLRETLDDPLGRAEMDAFLEKLDQAAKWYGYDLDRPWGNENPVTGRQFLESPHLLADLRHDAFAGLERLECHQFVQGAGDERPAGFNPTVWQFWNVNSLLRAMRGQMEPGISLCLIRDPVALRSFFVFAIRNGDNLLFLTDRAREPHPDFKRMSRSRAQVREYQSRASRYWLPYYLLDIKVSDDERTAYEASARTSLVPVDATGIPLAQIRDLHPGCFLWLAMMFDLISNRFWRQGQVAPQLSYTGEMAVEPHALVGEASTLVRAGDYQPLSLTPLDRKSMEGAARWEQWERPSTGVNRWMVERYQGGIDERLFQVTGDHHAHALVATLREEGALAPDPRRTWEQDPRVGSFREDPAKLRALDPTTFGTAEEIDRDRRWAARYNQVRAIQQAAEREFQEQVASATCWWETQVRARREFILDAAARGSLHLPSWRGTRYDLDGSTRSFFRPQGEHAADWTRVGEVLSQRVETGKWPGLWWYLTAKAPPSVCHLRPDSVRGAGWSGGYALEFGVRDSERGYLCPESGKKATIYTRITVNCPEAAAGLLGIPVADLPWWLQHYRQGEMPYAGNHILERLDPEDWILANPWSTLCLSVQVASAKSALHARRKALGLPRAEYPEDLQSSG